MCTAFTQTSHIVKVLTQLVMFSTTALFFLKCVFFFSLLFENHNIDVNVIDFFGQQANFVSSFLL